MANLGASDRDRDVPAGTTLAEETLDRTALAVRVVQRGPPSRPSARGPGPARDL